MTNQNQPTYLKCRHILELHQNTYVVVITDTLDAHIPIRTKLTLAVHVSKLNRDIRAAQSELRLEQDLVNYLKRRRKRYNPPITKQLKAAISTSLQNLRKKVK